MTVQSDWAVLTDEQQQFFEDNGYLVIEDALPPDIVAELNAAADEIYDREKAAGGLEKRASSICGIALCITMLFFSCSTGRPRRLWRGRFSTGISR